MTNHYDNIPSSSTQPGYQKTKLGWLPVEWKVERLDSLFSFKNGVNAGKEDYGKGVKFINVSEIFNNNSIQADAIPGSVAVSEDVVEKYAVKRGDVLFNRTSETQEEIAFAAVYLDDEKVVFGGFVIRARSVNDKMNDQFKKYCFQSSLFRKQVMAKGQGAVRANIGQNDLGTVKIHLPPLPEQQKIATILSTWDRAIALTRQLLQEKEAQKKGLMQWLLTGKVRVKGFEGTWKQHQLGELFTERKETGYTQLPLLAITADRGVILRDELEKKDTSNDNKSKYKRIRPGDIGYNTMRMWQGRSAVSNLEGIVSPAYTVVVPKQSIDVVFMGMLFQLPKTIHDFWRYSQGLVGDTLNCKYPSFSLVKVSIPSDKKEQTAIAAILTQADEEIRLLREKERALQAQKKGLMQRLLTGKVRVKVD
jgi:type I restriction enzyme S subunit